jgi:hypothetical protein
MSSAERLDPSPPPATEATLLVWVDRPRPGRTLQGLVGLTPPSFVFRSSGDLEEGAVDLAAFGCAHRDTAVAFSPGAVHSSVILSETRDGRGGAEYHLIGAGFRDLYTIGWAARAAALRFNP